MTTPIVLTDYEQSNPCAALLLLMTDHLTTPTRANEVKIFKLVAICANKEPATVATAATVLMIMADEVSPTSSLPEVESEI